jgi:hypothetical protein
MIAGLKIPPYLNYLGGFLALFYARRPAFEGRMNDDRTN